MNDRIVRISDIWIRNRGSQVDEKNMTQLEEGASVYTAIFQHMLSQSLVHRCLKDNHRLFLVLPELPLIS